jgi:glutamyl-tRNA synthetase
LVEIVSLFDLKDINKAPASFNEEKLLWLNQEYIKNATPEHLIEHLEWHLQHQKIDISNGADLALVVASLQQRSKTLVEMSEGLKMFYQDFNEFDEKLANKQFKDKVPINSATKSILPALPLPLNANLKGCPTLPKPSSNSSQTCLNR